jgi:CubicO group peptidase (beta-lactamase class C family)
MELVKPEHAGFNSSRLARIDRLMQAYIDEQKFAGIVTLVARRGELVHFQKFGQRVIETELPMELDTFFRIYSMTKPITAVAILMLLEEGRLRLNDPVSEYISCFKEMRVFSHLQGTTFETVPAKRLINLRDLLTHSSGLSYGLEENAFIDLLYQREVWSRFEKEELSLESLCSFVASLPLVFQPGSAFRYSLANDILGYIVQIVSGRLFGAFLKERLFEPLGMEDTFFMVPVEKRVRFSTVYGPGENGGLKTVDAAHESRYLRPPQFEAGGMGLVSTAMDYFRFAQMMLNRGEWQGERLLGRKTVELMTSVHLPEGIHPFENRAVGMGLGVDVRLEVGRGDSLGSPGTFGWGGAANTNFWVDPVEEIVGVFMAQFMPSDTYPAVVDFRNLVYQALL